jgi:hypothetical protein
MQSAVIMFSGNRCDISSCWHGYKNLDFHCSTLCQHGDINDWDRAHGESRRPPSLSLPPPRRSCRYEAPPAPAPVDLPFHARPGIRGRGCSSAPGRVVDWPAELNGAWSKGEGMSSRRPPGRSTAAGTSMAATSRPPRRPRKRAKGGHV